MKIQKITSIALIAMIAIGLSTLTSCKKNAITSESTADSTQAQTDDEVMTSNATDNASNDATASMESTGGSFAARPAVNPVNDTLPLPCHAFWTYDTATVAGPGAKDSIIITYTGNDCYSGYSRSGKIVLSFAPGFHWQSVNAQLIITYENYTVVRNSDHKSLVINGSDTITNVTGAILRNLNSVGPITHDINGTLYLTFNNGATATWHIAKERTFSYSNSTGIVTVSTTGSVTGINRFGNQFSTVINSPIVIQNGCGYGFRVTGGVVAYTAPIGTITLTYGLDAITHLPVAASTCPLFYDYEIVYVHNSLTYTYYAPYF
jgi:hypothetical protein